MFFLLILKLILHHFQLLQNFFQIIFFVEFINLEIFLDFLQGHDLILLLLELICFSHIIQLKILQLRLQYFNLFFEVSSIVSLNSQLFFKLF